MTATAHENVITGDLFGQWLSPDISLSLLRHFLFVGLYQYAAQHFTRLTFGQFIDKFYQCRYFVGS